MKTLILFTLISFNINAHTGVIVKNKDVKVFKNNGNKLQGLATPSKGSKQFEVWQSEIAPGSKTPLHKHETDEIFVFLKGEAKVIIGDRELHVKAPATVIAPAGKKHQVINTGKVPTQQIVIIGAGSKIWSKDGKVLNLPWRK
jgi:mannose-6-phosphate isomerase-like protein (cupin superfamily)